jgi:tRNA-specific 2-thiouridylase
LGIASPNPLFVTKIDAQNNALIVGSREKLGREGFHATRATWTQQIPVAGAKIAAQLRAHSTAHPASIVAADEIEFKIQFDAPSQGVTPGQMAVLYDGDEVVGAGTIS